MTDQLFGAAHIVMAGLGVYVFLLVVILAGAFVLAGTWVLVETAWRRGVRAIRRWRVGQDLEREREAHIKAVALTGTTNGLPRRTWEHEHPPAGGPGRVA